MLYITTVNKYQKFNLDLNLEYRLAKKQSRNYVKTGLYYPEHRR